jgi:hypothetical protein
VLKVGPITAGRTGYTTLQIGDAGGTVQLLIVHGRPYLGLPALAITCAAPSPSVNLAAVNISGAPTGVASDPSVGEPYRARGLTLGYFAGTVRTPLSCTANGRPVTVDTFETASDDPDTPPDSSFDFIDSSGSLTFPASFVKSLIARHAAWAAGSITTLDIEQIGGTPSIVNAANPPFVITRAPLVADQPLTIALPQSGGTYTVGPFGVGAGGVDVQTQGAAGGTVRLEGSSGNQIGSPITVSCPAPSPRVIVNVEGIT